MTIAGDGQQLSEDDQVVQLAVAVDVDRDHQHHGGGRHADEEREVRDVETPRHLVGHALSSPGPTTSCLQYALIPNRTITVRPNIQLR